MFISNFSKNAILLLDSYGAIFKSRFLSNLSFYTFLITIIRITISEFENFCTALTPWRGLTHPVPKHLRASSRIIRNNIISNTELTSVTDQSSLLAIVLNTCIPQHYAKMIKLVLVIKYISFWCNKRIVQWGHCRNWTLYFE